MTITGKPLYFVLVIQLAWLFILCWALWKCRPSALVPRGTRSKLTDIALIASTVAVASLFALHLSWTSVDLSQKMGNTGISIIGQFLFWPTLLGFFASLFASGRRRFLSLGTCILTGLWWFTLLMQAAISMGASTVRHPSTYSIPDGYIGWVSIEYNVPAMPTLPLKNGSLQVRFPATGLVQTTSSLENGWANDQYVYYTPTGPTKTLKQTGWGQGGMIWANSVSGDSDGQGELNHIQEKFFVGAEYQYKHSPGVADTRNDPGVGNQHR